MTKNLDKDGLSSIAKNYDLFYIDLWGVLHNGISLHQEAVKALNKLEQDGKEYVLLTNAPRPSQAVRVFLKNMQLDENIRNHVFWRKIAFVKTINQLIGPIFMLNGFPLFLIFWLSIRPADINNFISNLKRQSP